MVFSWMTVFGFVVFCFTVILREEKKLKALEEKCLETNEFEEIT